MKQQGTFVGIPTPVFLLLVSFSTLHCVSSFQAAVPRNTPHYASSRINQQALTQLVSCVPKHTAKFIASQLSRRSSSKLFASSVASPSLLVNSIGKAQAYLFNDPTYVLAAVVSYRFFRLMPWIFSSWLLVLLLIREQNSESLPDEQISLASLLPSQRT